MMFNGGPLGRELAAGSSWRHDTTAHDKKRQGCPNCYRKTYTKYELGEKCPNCGETIGVRYFFQSKAQLDDKGEGHWLPCQNEQQCREMAAKGFAVKKVVMNGVVNK